MATQEENVEKLKKLIEILEELRGNVTPESGLFLNNVSKKFGVFQEEAQAILDEIQAGPVSGKSVDRTKAAGKTTVYVSLFQTDPENIKQWSRTVKRISEYSLARPIYRRADHVEEMIRSRPDPRKEAYAAVILEDTDIIKSYAGKQETDSRGRELLTVKEGSVKPENIVKFVHGNTDYAYHDEQLIPTDVDQ